MLIGGLLVSYENSDDYDDNENNVRAVAELCKRFAPLVRITAYRVANGAISSPSGCNEVVNLRRKKIFSRTGRYS